MEPTKVNGFRPLVDLCKRDDIDAEVPILVVQSLAHLAAHPGIALSFAFVSANTYRLSQRADSRS